jgi:MoxR-like ATPase
MHDTDRDSSISVRRVIDQAAAGLVDRETLVELVVLGAVASEHVLVIGPPGTAKSEAVRRIARALGGQYFEYLLGRFTEPSEIFGPIDIRKLRDGIIEAQTEGMLPKADIAFLDEIFLGSTAILNTLLGVLMEKVYRRGMTVERCPLRVCVGASNALPLDESLAAFADRFLIRVFLEPIADPMLENLLGYGWSLNTRPDDKHMADLVLIDRLSAKALSLDVSPVRGLIAQAVRLLRRGGIEITDRRIVRLQRLVAAAAVIDGRDVPSARDVWPMVFALPTAQDQDKARDLLRELLEPTASETLRVSAAEASLGMLAKAAGLAAEGRRILEERPADGDGALVQWRLKIEGLAREIDASFVRESLPADLADLRRAIVQEIGEIG